MDEIHHYNLVFAFDKNNHMRPRPRKAHVSRNVRSYQQGTVLAGYITTCQPITFLHQLALIRIRLTVSEMV